MTFKESFTGENDPEYSPMIIIITCSKAKSPMTTATFLHRSNVPQRKQEKQGLFVSPSGFLTKVQLL